MEDDPIESIASSGDSFDEKIVFDDDDENDASPPILPVDRPHSPILLDTNVPINVYTDGSHVKVFKKAVTGPLFELFTERRDEQHCTNSGDSPSSDNDAAIYIDRKLTVAGIGVWFGDGHPMNISKAIPLMDATNVRAELYAIVEAMRVTLQFNNVTIFTDSGRKHEKEEAGGPNTSSSTSFNLDRIKNPRELFDQTALPSLPHADLWQQFISLTTIRVALKKQPVAIWNVPGHSGIYGNEKADELATAATSRVVASLLASLKSIPLPAFWAKPQPIISFRELPSSQKEMVSSFNDAKRKSRQSTTARGSKSTKTGGAPAPKRTRAKKAAPSYTPVQPSSFGEDEKDLSLRARPAFILPKKTSQ